MTQNLVSDINCLASSIVEVCENDASILDTARGIAHYILQVSCIPLATALHIVHTSNTKALIRQLLSCESECFGYTPRCLGPEIDRSPLKTQQSLNVKHFRPKEKNEKFEEFHGINLDPLEPQIKHNILYSHPEYVWIRVHCKQGYDYLLEKVEYESRKRLGVRKIEENIFEIYMSRNTKKLKIFECDVLNRILDTLNDDKEISLIFCSELSYFQYNLLLFTSNYLKFMYCYLLKKHCFEPQTFDEHRTTTILLIESVIFFNSTNMTNMSAKTHGPLIAYTGERPRIQLAKLSDPSKVYINEGTRAMQSTDRQSDLGSRSNFIDIEAVINTSESHELENII
ncbi:unnamed protein product [Bemisia tabaci]|uniref:Uncharacterized protein n=1 Tax=Bemisia tabaci TaxID=7038 RepID=A0A9P0F5N1_BEMTA|nr:unnamed protein product [Bemisia tabaci]